MLFEFSSKSQVCGIVFYDDKHREIKRVAFHEDERKGLVYTKDIPIESECYYLFYEEETLKPDYKAKMLSSSKYGVFRSISDCKGVCRFTDFEWKKDYLPKLEYKDSVFYTLHVRGFTMHSSSGVSNRGTYLGILEKIPYLKEIGITTLELQPAYEFLELDAPFERTHGFSLPSYSKEIVLNDNSQKLNYWGYKRGFYYAPKGAYAVNNACTEFKTLICELHKNNMELIMQFYFPDEFKRSEIPQILHYWREEYHVDGFHLMGNRLPVDLIAEDDLLADTKLIYYNFPTEQLYQYNEKPFFINLAEHEDGYMYDLRRFLKGDDNMMNRVLSQMRYIPDKAGRIHYLTNYNTLTMMDMVTYDYKHNEINGEENSDGTDYNASWNCGEEGPTKKKKVRQMRMKQIKNAYSLLLFSQSTPKIFMGDEFGNTQKGNNNPYCQDNQISWLDWSLQSKNKELLEFWKRLILFRKEHSILHPKKQLLLMDTLSCGYPDLSYHSESAWKLKAESYTRHIGIMYFDQCEESKASMQGKFIYIAVNMHWDVHRVGLPKLPHNMRWQLVFDTSVETSSTGKEQSVLLGRDEHICDIGARTIHIYKSIIDNL